MSKFNFGDKVRVIKKCSMGDRCDLCPPIGYVSNIIETNGTYVDLENYEGIQLEQLELVVAKSIPLPLPG